MLNSVWARLLPATISAVPKQALWRAFSTSSRVSAECDASYPNEPSGRVSTTTMKFIVKEEQPVIPMYRVMDRQGNVLDDSQDPKFGEEMCRKMYKHMVTLNVMDNILYDVQRQGRISFYMTCYGEEASHIGSASALKDEDVIFAQYREVGVLMWRGFTMLDCMNQCYSNVLDGGKGRQMPVHYGSAKLNFQTISSPLATQIPQAVGSAYAQKLMGQKACTIVYFGEGAASEGDFHAALNAAATLETPTIFFCRNNGYAISTPIREQFRGDGIASRGMGYGMDTIRVDGNDIWAVHNVTKAARTRAIEHNRPVLIESMSYRVSHHSTSDDSTHYRTAEEVEYWQKYDNPIIRLGNYMKQRKWWSDEEDEQLRKDIRKEALDSLKSAEAQKKPPLRDLFSDVYDKLPKNLEEQQEELKKHLEKYGNYYPLNEYAS